MFYKTTHVATLKKLTEKCRAYHSCNDADYNGRLPWITLIKMAMIAITKRICIIPPA